MPNDTKFCNFYAAHSDMSEPGIHAKHLRQLPLNFEKLFKILQGVLLLDSDAHLYNYKIEKPRLNEMNSRTVVEIINRIFELENKPIYFPRELKNRHVVSCRSYCILLAAILREHNIPCRLRYGFSNFKVFATDNTVLEYWSANDKRWILMEPFRTEDNMRYYKHNHDIYDLPHDYFITSDRAWLGCRFDNNDPNWYGVGFINDYRGWWYIRNKLLQDFLSLCKHELLPWDRWGIINDHPLVVKRIKNLDIFDAIAKLIANPNENFTEILQFHKTHPSFDPISTNDLIVITEKKRNKISLRLNQEAKKS